MLNDSGPIYLVLYPNAGPLMAISARIDLGNFSGSLRFQ
jgi:hypothetical protein